MASFQEVLTHAKNTDNHCWSAIMQYFEYMVPKTFMLPWFKKQKSHKFSNFSYPGSRKVLISAKIIISGQKCCCHLMQDSLKYLCIQFGYNWTKNKEMVKGVGGGGFQWTPRTYLTSKKPDPIGLRTTIWQKHANVKKSPSVFTLRTLWKQLSSKWWWQTNMFSSFSKCLRFNFEIQIYFRLGSFGSLKKT